jgi:hypothetical protein
MGSILLGAMLACGAASARELQPIVVDVPFEFIVNGKTLPAGKYTVRRQVQDSECVFYISRQGGGEGTSFTINAAVDMSAPNNASLIFHHYGSAYYLAEVVTGSNNTGYRLPVSNAERAAARAGTSAEPKSNTAGTESKGSSGGTGKQPGKATGGKSK